MEPGNVGLVTEPPFIDALNEQKETRTLNVQGVEYPASFAGFNQNGTDGVPSITEFINQAMTDCLVTNIIVSGYSQGALVVCSIAESLSADTTAEIKSIVTFGDPRNPEPLPGADKGNVMIFCFEDDAVCQGGFINVAHLTNGDAADEAAQFVTQ